MVKKITIEKSKLDILEKNIKNFNRIEKKQGIKEISKILTISNAREELKVYSINDYEYSRKIIDTILVIDIELFISEENRTQEEYNILAKIEKITNEENYITVYDERIYNKYTLDELIKIKLQCEHCRKKRARKTSYIVENLKTKEIKHIGKTCLIEYTTEKNIFNYLDYLESISEIESVLEKLNINNYSNFEGVYYDVKKLLALAQKEVDKNGYKTKYEDKLSTKNVVLENYTNTIITNEEINDIQEKIQWYLKIDKSLYYYDYKQIDSNFIFKIEKLLRYENTSLKNIGILVYFPIVYQQLKKKVKDKENKESTKEKIKELTYKEKDKIELNNLTLISNKKYQNEVYNTTTTYYYFLDDNNITYLWKSSRIIGILENTKEKINLKGTIKKIDDNKIILTRCKII